MITWVTVWFMVVSNHNKQTTSNSYAIPYSTKELCLKESKKINENSDNWVEYQKAKCVYGQMPVVKK
jgi:hypothetical protein